MKKFRKFAYVLLPFVLLALSGCGGGDSSSGGVFGDTSGGVTTGATTPAGTAPPFSLVVNTDISQVDANIGTVLATAQLKNASSDTVSFTDSAGHVVSVNAGAAVPDQVVTFTVLAGPATVGATTPVTDVNGLATAIITTQDAPYTTNVLLEAKTVVLGVTYRAYTSIQIVRGLGVIDIPQDLATPAGTLTPMEKTINPSLVSGFRYIQQIPFKLTDSNGNPRVGVPVTLSVYSQTGSSVVTVNYHAPTVSEPSAATVTTDSAGQGIFNVTVDMTAPPVGITLTDSVVYRAVTNDANPVTAYVGGLYTLTSASPLAIAPETVTFGTQTTIQLTVSGGAQPYSVSSSNPSRVSVSISGNIVTATLVDTSAWTTPVIISVTDAVGQTKSSTLSR